MKKILIVMFGIIFFSSTIYAATLSFSDVPKDAWYYNDVMNMAQWGVIRGNDDGTFKPQNNVNRAELSAMWNRYDVRVNNLINAKTSGVTTTPNNISKDQMQYIAGALIFPTFNSISQANTIIETNVLFRMENINSGSNFPSTCDRILKLKTSDDSTYDFAITLSPETITNQRKAEHSGMLQTLYQACEKIWNSK